MYEVPYRGFSDHAKLSQSLKWSSVEQYQPCLAILLASIIWTSEMFGDSPILDDPAVPSIADISGTKTMSSSLPIRNGSAAVALGGLNHL